ncbi:MAG: helix-turn-helix transcriptional regulator [Chloroflexota bacterium]
MTEILRLNSISELHDTIGYSKPKHPLITIIDFSSLAFTPAPHTNRVVRGFYSITLKKLMPGVLKYGRGHYDFQEGTLSFVAPEQVIEIGNRVATDEQEGWGLFFHSDLIRGISLDERMKEYTYFSYEANEALHLSEREKETITSIVEKIQDEYETNIDAYSHDVIVSNLELLLNYCNRFYGRQFITRRSQNKDVVTRFEVLLSDYLNSDKLAMLGTPTVKYCAEQVGFSPNYLSDLLRKEAGKSTQEHIHYHLIEKAKTRLLGSDSSVSEIAYELGLEYPQYFSKLFKLKTGVSPASYRILN